MASSSSFFTITQEEFNSFHSIDRELFTRLVINLGRDPGESMQVMALWLWLERAGHELLVNKMLSLPNTLINALADEAVLCLNCIEHDEFLFFYEGGESGGGTDIPLIQSLTKSEISLRFFHASRLAVIREVTKIVNDVCARAFQDILQKVLHNKSHLMGSSGINAGGENVNPGFTVPVIGEGQSMMMPMGRGFYGPVLPVPFYNIPQRTGVVSQMGSGGGKVNVPQILPSFGQIDPQMVIEASVNASEFSRSSVPFDIAIQRQILNVELSDLLSHINLTCTEEEMEVPPDDRTIFLTFSKGYPISENEVRDFFTGKYGDCIDAIYMQEVQAEEQVLFARLVVRSVSTINAVLEGQSKAKFAINGKHVWARRFVRKHPKSPSQAATPSSQPTSPAATAQL